MQLAWWVDYSVATNNAHATKTISIADARAATVRRWADGMAGSYPGIYAEFLDDMEVATAARTETRELAEAGYANAMVAAGAVWVETVLPAWVTYEDEVSDHTVSCVDTSSLAWETTQNDIADAGLDYTIAAVPVGTQLTEDLNQNFSEWVSDVAIADETYGNELADHAVTWVEAATAAGEGLGNDTIVNATTYVHLATGLNVLLAGAIGEAVINWAGTVAGQLTGTPYTPLTTTTGQTGADPSDVGFFQVPAAASTSTTSAPKKPVYIWINFGGPYETDPNFHCDAVEAMIQKAFDDAGINVEVCIRITTATRAQSDLGFEYNREMYSSHYGWTWLNPVGWIAAAGHDVIYYPFARDVLSWNGYIQCQDTIGGGWASTPNPNGFTHFSYKKMRELLMRNRDGGKLQNYDVAYANMIIHEQFYHGMTGSSISGDQGNSNGVKGRVASGLELAPIPPEMASRINGLMGLD